MAVPTRFCLAALLCTPALCPGVEGKGTAGGLAASPLGLSALMETAGGLLLILGLIVALAWLLRRYGRLPTAGKGMVTVLGGVSLGPRERAVVLQVGETRLLVGVAPGRVQTLHVIEEQAERPLEEAVEPPFGSALRAELEMKSR